MSRTHSSSGSIRRSLALAAERELDEAERTGVHHEAVLLVGLACNTDALLGGDPGLVYVSEQRVDERLEVERKAAVHSAHLPDHAAHRGDLGLGETPVAGTDRDVDEPRPDGGGGELVSGVLLEQVFEDAPGLRELTLVHAPHRERQQRIVVAAEADLGAGEVERPGQAGGRVATAPQLPQREAGKHSGLESSVGRRPGVTERDPGVVERIVKAVQRPGKPEPEVDPSEDAIVLDGLL